MLWDQIRSSFGLGRSWVGLGWEMDGVCVCGGGGAAAAAGVEGREKVNAIILIRIAFVD